MSERVSAARLEGHVRKLSVDFVPRDAPHPENLAKVAAYLHGELAGLDGGAVARVPFEVDGRPYEYLVASFGPAEGERVVVGAHYDAAGPLPGADDNASGVAGVLELARLLSERPPSSRVDLAFWPLEEMPHFRTGEMGSRFHARALAAAGVKVRAMISVEMIGCFSDEEGSQTFPLSALKWVYPTKGNFITVVGKLGDGPLVRTVKRAMKDASPLPVESINAPRFVPGVDFSDHASFWEEGFPALMVTDTAFFRNPRYHTAEDTFDTLDYRRMADVVRGLEAAVRALGR